MGRSAPQAHHALRHRLGLPAASPFSRSLLVLIGTAAWCAYATQWVNYGAFSLSVTSYVAFLLALLGLPEAEVAAHRVLATLLGAAIALVALALVRLGGLTRPRPPPP